MNKITLFFIFLLVSSALIASEGTNEWSGGWPDCPPTSSPGRLTTTELIVPDQTDIRPLATNILIQKFSIRNSYAGTNNLPILSTIRLDLIGTASDSDIDNVHFYYDKDGVWNGNELEFRTNATNNYIFGTKFSKNYSPGIFQDNKVNFGLISTDEMGLHLPWSNTYYYYITVDISQNIIDKATIDTRIYGVKMLMYVGCYWEQNMADIDTAIDARLNVIASNLEIIGEPPAPGIDVDTPFSLTVKAVDQYGNIDKDYTGTVYFSSTDPHAVIPYPSASPYTFQSSDEGIKTFNNFKLYSGPKENITVSDGAEGLNDDVSDDIIVIADVDHFKLLGDNTNLPYEPTITAGQALSTLGVTNIKVAAYNYLASIIAEYTGSVYFHSSLNGPYDSFPADINNKYTFTGIGIDDGTHNFLASKFILTKAGKQNLILTEGIHTGEWLNITVVPDNYSKLLIECETNVTAGTFFPLTIQATDPYDNLIEGVSTSLNLEIERLDLVTDKPVEAIYPASGLKLSGGTVSISDENSVKINEGGNFRLNITDINSPTIKTYKDVYVDITLEGANDSAVAYNYIHRKGSSSVDIYYNNKTTSYVSVEVEIYTLAGKCIKKFEKQTSFSGVNRLKSWDAKNDNSEKVASGVYLAVIKAGSKIEKHFIVVVK